MKILINKNGNVVLEEKNKDIDYQYVSPLDDENYYSFEVSESLEPLISLSNTVMEYLDVKELNLRVNGDVITINRYGVDNINDGYFHVKGKALPMSIHNQKGTDGYNALIKELYYTLEDAFVNAQ